MQESTIPLILSIDIGSSSVKCLFFECKRSAPLPHPYSVIKTLEFDVVRTTNASELCSIIDHLVDIALNEMRQKCLFKVIAVGISSFVMNFVGLNSKGVPVLDVMTYSTHQSDNTTVSCAKSFVNEESIRVRTGTYFRHMSYALLQISNLLPEDRNKVQKWSSISGLLLSRWTRNSFNYKISVSEASWTGMMNFRTMTWDPFVLDEARISAETLPTISDIPEVTVGLNDNFYTRWPELHESKFFCGFGDGVAANFGSLCDTPNRIAVTIGTSAACRVVYSLAETAIAAHEQCTRSENITANFPDPPEGLWCYRIDGRRVLYGGALTDGGSLIHWLTNLIGTQNMTEAMKEVEMIIEKGNMNELHSGTIDMISCNQKVI